MTQPELEQQVAQCLTQRGLTLSVAESCTGGLLSARITDVAGASKFYKGGACTYCNEIKQKILGVRAETLETYTAVSQQTAAEMAQGIARVYETDLGVGITGYAGPDGGEDGTPVGTIYIGLFWKGSTQVRKIVSPHGRSQARQDAADEALCMILHAIKE